LRQVNDETDIADELGSGEHALADRLRAQRPLPAAGFRGALRRRLAAQDPGYGPRPARLRLIVAGYVGAGSLLIAVGALAGVL
jgi:hypothetical protein